MRKWILVLMLISPSFVHAGDAVEFTNRELDAAMVFVHPEKNSIYADGHQGIFEPAPSLRYFGVERQVFDIDLRMIGDLVDLRISNLRMKTPEVVFENGSLRLSIPIEDNSKAIRSNLGSLGFKGVTISSFFEWKKNSNGTQYLSLRGVSITGKLLGSGVLRSGLVLKQVQKLMTKTMTKEIEKILNRDDIQSKIREGLLQWAKLTYGETYSYLTPASVQFFSDRGISGISFEAER